MAFVPGPTASQASGGGGDRGLLSRLEAPTGIKGHPKGPCPPPARLAVRPGTKTTYCPGPKGCRDKWPGTKAYSVVVFVLLQFILSHNSIELAEINLCFFQPNILIVKCMHACMLNSSWFNFLDRSSMSLYVRVSRDLCMMNRS